MMKKHAINEIDGALKFLEDRHMLLYGVHKGHLSQLSIVLFSIMGLNIWFEITYMELVFLLLSWPIFLFISTGIKMIRSGSNKSVAQMEQDYKGLTYEIDTLVSPTFKFRILKQIVFSCTAIIILILNLFLHFNLINLAIIFVCIGILCSGVLLSWYSQKYKKMSKLIGALREKTKAHDVDISNTPLNYPFLGFLFLLPSIPLILLLCLNIFPDFKSSYILILSLIIIFSILIFYSANTYFKMREYVYFKIKYYNLKEEINKSPESIDDSDENVLLLLQLKKSIYHLRIEI